MIFIGITWYKPTVSTPPSLSPPDPRNEALPRHRLRHGAVRAHHGVVAAVPRRRGGLGGIAVGQRLRQLLGEVIRNGILFWYPLMVSLNG